MANRSQVIERIIVARNNQALKNVAGGGTGDNIYDLAAKNYTLADGQIGIVYMDNENPATKDTLIDVVANIDALTTKKIQIVQGTAYSGTGATFQNALGVNDTYDPRVLRSGIIDCSKPVRTMGTGMLSMWERLSASRMSGLVAVNNVDYSYHLKVEGISLNKINGAQNIDNMYFRITSPDFTTLATVSPTDYLYKYLGVKAAQSSAIWNNAYSGSGGNSPYMVFGVCANGATDPTFDSVAYTLPLVSALISGATTSIVHSIVINPATGTAIPMSITPDEAFRQMLLEAVANGQLATNDKIGILDTTQAGASATVNCFKGLLFVGMKTSAALVQDEEGDARITSVTLSADRTNELNSPSATLAIASRKRISEGKAAIYQIRYNQDAAYDLYSRQVWGSNFDFIPKYTPITAGEWYTAYIFESELAEQEYNGQRYSVGEVIIVRTILLVESAAPVATAQTGGVTSATTKANLITYLAPILDSIAVKLGYSTYTFN